MAAFTVTIPGYLPTSLNRLLSMHWAERSRVKKSEAELIAVYVVQAAVPQATTKRRVTLTFSAPGGRGAKIADADNRQKILLDALARCGALVDDAPAFCEVVVASLKGPKQTTIVLEDLP